MSNHVDDEIRKWTSERFVSGRDSSKSCSVQCGMNHHARDCVRATLLHSLHHLERHERHDMFMDFMKNNEFLDMDSYLTEMKVEYGLKIILVVIVQH